jgi:nitroreductase
MEFFDVIKSRRSVRAFKASRVAVETMNRLLETVQSAPTAGNLQAYQVYLTETPDTIRALAKAAGDQGCVVKAPAVLVFCADAPRSAARYRERGTSLYCIQDATIAATMAHLAAIALGLGSVLVGAFDERQVALIVGAPPGQRPILMLPVGYPDEDPASTGRRAIDDLVVRC